MRAPSGATGVAAQGDVLGRRHHEATGTRAGCSVPVDECVWRGGLNRRISHSNLTAKNDVSDDDIDHVACKHNNFDNHNDRSPSVDRDINDDCCRRSL
jgi:hypothetical protein